MKTLSILILLVSAISLNTCWSSYNEGSDCSQLSEGSEFFTTFDKVHPTQSVFGKRAISRNIKKIHKAYKKNKIENFLKEKFAPAVVGPNCMLYIIDRHHTSYSILTSKLPLELKKLFVHIKHNWSGLEQEEFEQRMIDNKYTWLKNEFNQKIKFSELPTSILDLIDYPHRSLAWKVRREGGFNKVDLPFLEFFWAEFFERHGINPASSSKEDIKAVLDQAIELAKSPAAKEMPGFIGDLETLQTAN